MSGDRGRHWTLTSTPTLLPESHWAVLLVPGQMVARFWEGCGRNGSIRTLKLPLPRVDLQPFPPAWPRPARPLPPLLLQPTLQRYFWPDRADPDNYS